MELKNGIKTFYAKSEKQWRDWLRKNHKIEKSVWLIIYKKESNTPSIYYSEAVDQALCFGWIDSKANKRDDNSYYQYFSKRNAKSNWSKINKDKVEKLSLAGMIEPAGLEMINIDMESGTWNKLDGVDSLAIPEDLQKLFNIHKSALRNWNDFSRSSRRAILEWIQNAKRPETRMKRISETIRLAGLNKKANQPGSD